jgi:hypothetical protein
VRGEGGRGRREGKERGEGERGRREGKEGGEGEREAHTLGGRIFTSILKRVWCSSNIQFTTSWLLLQLMTYPDDISVWSQNCSVE